MFLEAPDRLHASKYLAAAELASPAATRREQLKHGRAASWAADDLPEACGLRARVRRSFRVIWGSSDPPYFEFNRGNSPEMLRVR